MLLAENKAETDSLADLFKERQQFSDELRPVPPSIQGNPSEFSKLQQKESQKIMWSRPPANDATIPVTLLHPIFRQFVNNCENYQAIQEDNKLVLELMGAMSNFFLKENVRAAKVRNILTTNGIPV